MGKKKQQKETPVPGKPAEEKGKKTYSLASAKQDVGNGSSESLPKVSIPGGLERELLALIQELNLERKLDREVSKRLTSKKLMDIYTSLSSAGFGHKQIEQAMESTILHGGDLIDALDWLCLNLPNDKLPGNFSETLQREEDKKRPLFDVSQQTELGPYLQEAAGGSPSPPGAGQTETAHQAEKGDTSATMTQKDWIMQYAEEDSDSGESEGEEKKLDPNERYLELTALLLDAKAEAAEVKLAGQKAKQKEVSKRIRELIVEMNSLEEHRDFNPAVKISNIDAEKSVQPASTPGEQNQPKIQDQPKSRDQPKSHDQPAEDNGDLGLSLFQEVPEPQPTAAKAKVETAVVKEDVRNFEYTRQQWTGKSPKQFLIDWIRKHLPKSPPPKFHKVNTRGNKHRCKAIVQKKDGMLEQCPTILCLNVKEAEHLASTLALYHLCKGQPVYQLLPPPYRDVWLEWLDAEKKAKMEEKSNQNKPRDQFLTRLMSKIQICDKGKSDDSPEQKQPTDDDDDTLDSWENFDDEEKPAQSKPSVDTVHPKGRPARGGRGGGHVRGLYQENVSSARYQELLTTREQLPVYQHREVILEKLRHHDVMLVAGETGSGKSTQVPHFILQNCLSSGADQCNIVCTQPRRISATSLASRVSQEMGEKDLGNARSLCGYQIRFESKCGPNVRLTYCTTGVILRKLQMDPKLRNITHVIVDEVHERSVQSDFLLIILRQLVQERRDLKVILMSATLDADKFSAYFSHCPVISIPGRTFPVKVLHIEDVVESTGYVLDEDSPYSLRQADLVQEESASVSVTEKGGNQAQVDVFWTKENVSTIDRTNLSADDYSLKTRNVITRLNMKRINMDMIVELLLYLEKGEQFHDVEGAVLIFLPGLADITELHETLQCDHRFSNKSRYLILALHSVLSSTDQSLAFSVPPAGVRKIVLATNIAETGITIPDVVFVIDAGKVKENRYIESSQMNALEEVWISKANAKQRQGRAGRVQSGFCFRMFTKQMYGDMKQYTVPELLRVPLEELCLHIMKCDYGKPEKFLSRALDPPQAQVVSRAMNLLHMIGACVEGEELTPLGHHLAALPVHVRIGKMLLYAAVFGCLEPVAVIAAAMTDKSPFAAPLGKQELATMAKQALAVAASDHLTVYKAYLGWKAARSKGRQAEMSYCHKNYLKRNTLLEIENVKSDLLKLIHSIGFTDTVTQQPRSLSEIEKDGVLLITKSETISNLDARMVAKVKAVLTAGLYPNIAWTSYEAPVDAAANPEQKVCVAETGQGPAHVHPSSVNRLLQTNGWMVFHQKVRSSRIYLRDCSLISAYPLLLFGGEIHVQHTNQLLSIDDRVKYKAFAKTGVIFKEIRKLIDDLLARKLHDPTLDVTNNRLVTLVQDLLGVEKSR